jgi:chorismate mutase
MVWVVAVLAGGCAGRPDPAWSPGPVQARMVELMGERLEVARQVAWYKFREGLPVRDWKRERASLRVLTARGKAMGLSSFQVGRFFRAQMAASRMVQKDLMAGWKAGLPVPTVPPPDLARDLRPRIDAIDADLLVQVAGARHSMRGREISHRAELYLLALDIPHDAVLKAIGPLR